MLRRHSTKLADSTAPAQSLPRYAAPLFLFASVPRKKFQATLESPDLSAERAPPIPIASVFPLTPFSPYPFRPAFCKPPQDLPTRGNLYRSFAALSPSWRRNPHNLFSPHIERRDSHTLRNLVQSQSISSGPVRPFQTLSCLNRPRRDSTIPPHCPV